MVTNEPLWGKSYDGVLTLSTNTYQHKKYQIKIGKLPDKVSEEIPRGKLF